MAQTTPASTLEHLTRLAAKPGVQSTLVLSKTDGSIIQSSGLARQSEVQLPPPEGSPTSPRAESRDLDGTGNGDAGSKDVNSSSQNGANTADGGGRRGNNTAEEVAKMVFSFVSAARLFAERMDTADDVKLLRMRTRKNEIVIVPDAKFLLVVIHDTPPA